MKVLIVGGGGREHAIAWKLSQSERVDKIYCAPGNAGIAQLAECVNIAATDIPALVRFAVDNAVDFTVVGMDDPLVAGIVDEFQNAGLKIFGPNSRAAVIEGSKAFSKELMKKYSIPTAAHVVFADYNSALEYVRGQSFPIVVKADGLALGKGVLICADKNEAEQALRSIMIDKRFGDSGSKVVIEEFLTGPEVSVLAFCDGKNIAPMVSAQDHKRAFDGNEGPNTGGMGTFSPSRYYTPEIAQRCMEEIFLPTVNALNKENRPFKGVIFFGLMLTNNGPKVIEYNARFGDPETQVVLIRLKTDIMDIFEACVDGTLDKLNIEWSENAAACVVLASGGYPASYEKGFEITGLEKAEAAGAVVFHAGTAEKNGKLVTNGGRVLGVTAVGDNLDTAVCAAYKAVDCISFKKMQYRKDIGKH